MFSWKNKIILIFSFVLITGCASYSKLSDTERIVTFKNLLDNEEITYIEKFDDRTNQWFDAVCGNSNDLSGSLKQCSNNTEFTDASKEKIYVLLYDNGNNLDNQNSNSNDSGETSNEYENDDSEDEEDEEEDWDPNNSGE